MCVHVYETEFFCNTGPEHWVLKKISMSESFAASSCGFTPCKRRTFQEERFFCCFCFTADTITSFQSKISYCGFSSGATAKPTSLTAPGLLFGGGQKVEDSQVHISIASSIAQ